MAGAIELGDVARRAAGVEDVLGVDLTGFADIDATFACADGDIDAACVGDD